MSTRDAVIVSTARTPIGRAYRGAFNATPSPTLAAHAIRAVVQRAKLDPAEIDDVIMGAALQQGVQTTIGRTAALRAALPRVDGAPGERVGVPVYVVDPNGFVILRYAPGFDPGHLRQDMARLLKLR